jgi:hypothetical protein
LAGFAVHGTSAVTDVNGKLSCDKENAQDSHSKQMRDTGGADEKTHWEVKQRPSKRAMPVKSFAQAVSVEVPVRAISKH